MAVTCAAAARRFIPLCCAGVTAWSSALAQLAPSQALASFRLEPNLRLELVAAEPAVVNPVALAFDERGRLYVAENRDYPTGPRHGLPPAGTVALLEDRDGDGAFEARSDFASGLTFPNGVLPWNGGVYVTCAPDLLYFKDTNSDGKADVRQVVLTGFSTNSTTQLRVSHPTLAPDGWIYLTSGLGTGGKVYSPGKPGAPVEYKTDCRFNPITGQFEPTEARAQFGLSFDDAGHRFICMNRVHVQHVVMPSRYLKRNPHLGIADAVQNCPEHMSPEPLKGHGAAARIYPLTEHVTTADSHEGTFTAACGVFLYSGGALPPAYRGNVFACEPTANLVHRDELIATGSTFAARRAVEGREFLASTDSWFRPVFLASGPDGALYICDMYRKTIEHPEYLPVEVRKGTDFESGKGLGRIYRVTGATENKRKAPAFNSRSLQALSAGLSSPNGWTRNTAQRLLLEKWPMNTNDTASTLLAGFNKRPAGQVQRLRLLDTLGALNDKTLLRALSHPDPGVRENAAQLAEQRLTTSTRLASAVLKLANDPHPRVRMQCALTLGELRGDTAIATLAALALKDSDDPWSRLAILASAADRESTLLDELLKVLPKTQEGPGSSDGIFSLLYDLGRLTALSASNFTRLSMSGIVTGKGPYSLSVCSGLAEARRNHSLPANFQSQLQPVILMAEKTARDPTANAVLRQHATSLLALGEYGRVRGVLLALLAANEPTPRQFAAVRALSRFQGSEVVSDLISTQRWHSYTPAVRDAVLNALLSDARHLPAMLGALEAGAIPVSVVDSNRRRQLLNHKDPGLRARAESLFKTSADSNRTKVFEDWKEVLALTPVPSNGRAVFKQHCGACHRLDREGANVGPDLFGIRNQPKEAILLHIIIPEQEIAPGFAAYDVQTKDGRAFTGLIVADTPSAVTIRGGQGQEETIARSNIASLASEGLSLMPQGLEQNMTRQDMADLLAFLKGQPDRPAQ